MGAVGLGAFGAPQRGPDNEATISVGSNPYADVKGDGFPRDSEQGSDLSNESPSRVFAGPPDLPETEELAIDSDDEKQTAVAVAIQALQGQVKGFHARAENYEQIIRQMQSRIEQLQGDQVQALLKPVIQRFAGLHAQAAEASEMARGGVESAEKDFSFFAVAIEEALGLVDIESVGAAPGVEFDSRRHHASRIVPTDDPHLDQRVQRVLRQGFTYIGAPRVFLPAQVSIYRYDPPQPVADNAALENNPTSEPGEGDPRE